MKKSIQIRLLVCSIFLLCCLNETHAQLFTQTNPEGAPPPESPNPFLPEEIKPNTLVALVGDMGITDNTQKVFDLIKFESTRYKGDTFAIVLGDLGYEGKDYAETISRAKKWENMKDTTLVNNGIPAFIVVGNHELKAFPYWDGKSIIPKFGTAWDHVHYPAYKKFIADLEKKENKNICNGDPGVLSACQYKGIFWIESAIKLILTKDKHINFTKEQLALNDSIWKMCTWHLNRTEMQAESKSTWSKWTVNWDMYTACLNEGTIVATGHQHSYQRTFTLNDLENESRKTQTNKRFNSPLTLNSIEHVEDATSRPLKNAYDSVEPATFVTVSGLGGRPNIYPQQRCLDPKEKCYKTWASVYAAPKAIPGVFFIRFNPDGQGQRLAQFYFRNIKGEITDSGWITSGNRSNFIDLGRTNKTPRTKISQHVPPSCVDNYGTYSAMVGLPRPQQTRYWDHNQITCSSEALVGAGPLAIIRKISRNYINDQDLGCDDLNVPGYMSNFDCRLTNCQFSDIECVGVQYKNKKLTNIKWTPMDNQTTKKMDCQEFFGPKSVVVNVDINRESYYRIKCADLVDKY